MSMILIIVIAANVTATETTIPMTILQVEVTQLTIMTTTIPMTNIRVEKIMESEDLDWSVLRYRHPTPISSS